MHLEKSKEEEEEEEEGGGGGREDKDPKLDLGACDRKRSGTIADRKKRWIEGREDASKRSSPWLGRLGRGEVEGRGESKRER